MRSKDQAYVYAYHVQRVNISMCSLDEKIYTCGKSQVEIEYYSVAYFDHVTTFKAL